jgi:hypothetical protein
MDSQRATSLEQLSDANPNANAAPHAGMAPPQQGMQQTPHGATDNELVQDILQEMQSNDGPALPSANAAALAHQMDAQVHDTMPPDTQAEMQAYAEHARGEDHAPAPTFAPVPTFDAALTPTAKGFSLVEFAKTTLLFMILYIVVTSGVFQSLVRKVPVFCTVVEGADPTVNFMGTVAVALVAGLLMAGVQVFV